MAYVPTLLLMTVLKARLTLLTDADNGTALLFQDVVFSGKRDTRHADNRDLLLQTLRERVIGHGSFCVVFPFRDVYVNSQAGDVLEVRRYTELLLFVGCWDYTPDTGQLLDLPDGPGVLTLKDRLVADLVSTPLELGGDASVWALPLVGSLHQFGEDDAGVERGGLAAWEQMIRVNCGVSEVATSDTYPSLLNNVDLARLFGVATS